MNTNLPEHKDRLRKLTNFSGSNGYTIITADESQKSQFVTDSRYEIQVASELDASLFDITTDFEPISKRLQKFAKDYGNMRVGVDGVLFKKLQVDAL